MRIKCLIAGVTCLFLTSSVFAQTVAKKPGAAPVMYAPIPDSATGSATAMATYLVKHNDTQLAILQSLYVWMSSHITYDMVNTFKPDYYKDTADAVHKTLQTRTAVCQGYASLFMDVARKAGIPAWLVTGYPLKGGQPDVASHAWVAVFTDNKWQLIDPTWGAGTVENHKYLAKLNWSWFLLSPAAAIKTHVPFDPLFQFLDKPLRHDEIRDGKWTAAPGTPVFAYADTLAAFAHLNRYQQAQNAAARIDRYGITNQMIAVELNQLRNMVAYGKQSEEIDAYNGQANIINQASNRYNALTNDFNDYVAYRNNQFSPSRPDAEIREWIDGMAVKVEKISQSLAQVTEPKLATNVAEITTALTGIKKRIAEEQEFVTKYIKTGKLFRKSLFYKFRFS